MLLGRELHEIFKQNKSKNPDEMPMLSERNWEVRGIFSCKIHCVSLASKQATNHFYPVQFPVFLSLKISYKIFFPKKSHFVKNIYLRVQLIPVGRI